MGVVTQILSSTSVIISSNHLHERVPKGKACTKLIPTRKRSEYKYGIESMSTQA